MSLVAYITQGPGDAVIGLRVPGVSLDGGRGCSERVGDVLLGDSNSADCAEAGGGLLGETAPLTPSNPTELGSSSGPR